MNVFKRNNYDLLAFIGDLGGITSGLFFICNILISSYANLNGNFVMISLFFTMYKKFDGNEKEEVFGVIKQRLMFNLPLEKLDL